MAEPNYFRLTSLEDNNVIALRKRGTPPSVNVEYRTNLNSGWRAYTIDTELTLFKDSWIEMRNDTGTFSTSTTKYYYFTMTKRTAASGSVDTLLNYTVERPTLAESCYRNMFQDCTSLTTAPELPAVTLTTRCYQSMFSGCTSLTTAQKELPATTLATYCYANMFQDCTSLTTAPELPAATLAGNCYSSMFYGCTRLNKIVYKGSGLSYTSSWLADVSPTGTFYYTNQNLVVGSIQRTASGVPADWTIQYLAPKPPLVFSINGHAVASLTINGKAVAKLGA